MMSLIFMVCIDMKCMTVANPNIFTDLIACEEMGQRMIIDNRKLADEGKAPPHTATYQCVSWTQA